MLIDQISVFVENKPGRLSEILGKIAESNTDIRALSLADTSNFGILRMIVSDPSAAENALKSAGLTVSRTAVIAVSVEDSPGALYRVLEYLRAEGISVEYAYAFITRENNNAYVIIRVEDNKLAVEVLQKNGIQLMSPSNVYSL